MSEDENANPSHDSTPETWEDALEAAEAGVVSIDVARGRSTISPSSVLGTRAPGSYSQLLDLVHREDRERVHRALSDACSAPAGAKHHLEFRLASGVWLGIVAKTMGDGSIRGLIQNHGERRRLDEAQLRAIQELSLSARAAEVFVSMVAHDLKNPLNVIMGSAHAALEGPPPPLLRSCLERVHTNTERAARMLQHLRDYSRGRPAGFVLEREPVELRSVVDAAIAAGAAATSPEVVVTGDCTGSWDRARLEHAFASFVDDAFTRAGSTGRLRITLDGSDSRNVSATIETTGLMSRREIENAFRPFGAPEAERGPSLFGARLVVVAHGGEVVLTAGNEEGTTFRVSLPRDVSEPPGVRMNAWDELAALEGGTPLATGITARIFGARPLYERAPTAYWRIFERYASLFDDALNRRIYRNQARPVGEETRTIADALGSLGAGANEVAELHARALKQRLRDASATKAQVLVAEGRLLAFEVMGHLVTWYRRRAIVHLTENQGTKNDEG